MPDIAVIRQRLVNDIEYLRAPEGYIRAGYPRFFTLMGRDSLITAWQLLSYDPSIAKRTLKILTQFQGKKCDAEHEEEPGKIMHEWWGDLTTKTPSPQSHIAWPFPYYGSVDVTPLFVILASLYYEHTHDEEFVRELRPSVSAALDWIQSSLHRDKDPFLEYTTTNEKGLYYQSWRDGLPLENLPPQPLELVEVQGYVYAAFTFIQPVLELYKDQDLIKKTKEEASRIKDSFNEKYWWQQEQYYYSLFDKEDRPELIVTSCPGHLLFTGIIDSPHTDAVVKRMFQPDLWTPYGIRTVSTASPIFDPTSYQLGPIWPHDNWIIAQGLKKLDFLDQYAKIEEALLRMYQKLGTMPELVAVSQDDRVIAPKQSNEIQAWSSGSLLNMVGPPA